MTQLGEAVAFGVVSENDIECPFEHVNHTCGSSKNVIPGESKKLGDNLNKMQKDGTVVTRSQEDPYSNYVGDTGSKSYEAYPLVAPEGHPDWYNWVQLIAGNENTWYPVVFQAHHLIPGDGSLKVAPKILQFIESNGSGVICCNLGYDVNGKENGVWLPGKSAVAGGDLGIKLWSAGVATRNLPDKEYATRIATPRLERDTGNRETFAPLGGGTPSASSKAPLNEVFHEQNMKWLYVQKATTLASPHRQFHDSHTKYYNKVKDHLQAIGAILERFRTQGAKYSCKECSKPQAKRPSPAKLLGVLNTLSSLLRGKVLGPTAGDVYFTSDWSNAIKIAEAAALRAAKK